MEPVVIRIDAIDLRFEPAKITIPAYTPVMIEVTNRGNVYHGLVIPGPGPRTANAGPGEIVALTFEAAPGSYPFFCTIQSHNQAGMEGMLVVE